MNRTVINREKATLEEQFLMEANIRDKNKVPILIRTEEFSIYFADKKGPRK